ncbi:MAG: septum site-determining protein MinD [Firmicutes bacterium]|nr:septum site-determining protein MinD [Bacillota bacterium]
MGRRIVITSGKGGVGKTSVTANLGMCLAGSGFSVALVDADMSLNNLDVTMGLEHLVVYDMGDIIDGKCRLRQALVKDERFENLYILPSAKVNAEKISQAEFFNVVKELNDLFDFVLIDSPAGIDLGFHRAVASARETLVVTTPHIGAVRDADKVCNLLFQYKQERAHLVVNRVRADMVNDGRMMHPHDISSLLKLPLAGVIPEDDNITVSGTCVNENHPAFKAYDIFKNFILGNSEEIYEPKRAGMLSRIINFYRKG